MYLITAVTKINFGKQFQDISQEVWNLVDTVLSLINSGYLIIAWYMMRDFRKEQEQKLDNPLPTMSKPFISIVFATGASIIALFIALVGSINKEYVLPFFKILDVFISAAAIILVGSELLKIKDVREPEEGSFFTSDRWHRKFRILTFILYFIWGAFQLAHHFSGKAAPGSFFSYPDGIYYSGLAVLKLLCATTAAILILHSLPTVQWKHKQPK
jgi:hypothetical protein